MFVFFTHKTQLRQEKCLAGHLLLPVSFLIASYLLEGSISEEDKSYNIQVTIGITVMALLSTMVYELSSVAFLFYLDERRLCSKWAYITRQLSTWYKRMYTQYNSTRGMYWIQQI